MFYDTMMLFVKRRTIRLATPQNFSASTCLKKSKIGADVPCNCQGKCSFSSGKVVNYINEMYEQYHTERIENAIQDIERKCR